MVSLVTQESKLNPELDRAVQSIERLLDNKYTIQQTLEIYFSYLYRVTHDLPVVVRPFIARMFREVADVIERDQSSPSSSSTSA